MDNIANNNLGKTAAVIIALVIAGVSFFSMAVMNHSGNNLGCMAASHHDPGCGSGEQSRACINFHFSLMEKFSHGFGCSTGYKFLASLFSLSVIFLISISLLSGQQKYYRILKVRLRQLYEETASVFKDALGFWLTLFEKRDPAYAAVFA